MTAKVGLCITDLEPGGAERCLVEVACRLDRQRFLPLVYCLARPPEPPRDRLIARLADAGIAVEFLHASSARGFLPALARLTGLLRRDRPRLLQTFLFHANVLGRLAGRFAGTPRVVSGLRVAEHGKGWHRWVDRMTSGLVERYVCVSDGVARFAAASGLPEAKLAVIRNGIDVGLYPAERADLSRLGIPAGAPVAICVARLERQKGIDWLLETVPGWLGRYRDWHLLIVGDGPERRNLERRAASSGLREQIHFALWRADVPALLAASRLFLLPSRWEGMSNAVLEAMASGLPVLATRVEGMEELLGPGYEDQTVEFGDTAGLIDRLGAWIESPQVTQGWGVANRRRAMEFFSLDSVAAHYQGLWEELL